MLQHLKIAYLSKQQNVWFIRADKGRYAKHFRTAGIIAIGHVQKVYGDTFPSEIPTEEELRSKLLSNDKYSEFRANAEGKDVRGLNRSGFNLLSQIKRFANEIKAGDLIVTRNENDDGYSFGICTEDAPYIDSAPVKIPKKTKDGSLDYEKTELPYILRKKVTWGPSISREDLPGAVKKATRGHQTVTSLNNHKEKIYHLIYPFFTDGKSLYFSNKIKTKHPVNALVIGTLFQNLSTAQFLADAIIHNEQIDLSNLRAILERQILRRQSEIVTCQAEFMSPGDIWCKIPIIGEFSPTSVLACVLACLILTGQVSSEEIKNISLADTPITVTTTPNSEDDIFNDRFKQAAMSPMLKAIAENAEEQESTLSEKEEGQKIVEVRDNLDLTVSKADTSKLENFEFGIGTMEIGRGK